MKKLFFMLTVFVLSIFGTIAAYAAGWQSDATGWWYSKDDGSYFKNEWLQDGGWFYFNDAGYMVTNQWVGDYYLGSTGSMLTNTITPDGYRVDYNGVWNHGRRVDLNNGYFAAFAVRMNSSSNFDSPFFIKMEEDCIDVDGFFYTCKGYPTYVYNGSLGELLGRINIRYYFWGETVFKVHEWGSKEKRATRPEFMRAVKKNESALLLLKVKKQQVEEACLILGN